MSYYCELEVLSDTPVETMFISKDICYIETTLNEHNRYKVVVSELSLDEIIGTLRAVEKKLGYKIFVKYGVYRGKGIFNSWLDELSHLPYLRPWQKYLEYLEASKL
jgi:hypothetical protein